MTNWMKLALPISLGLAAGGLNWLTIAAKIAPHPFVKVSADLKEGEHFAPSNLAKVELSGDLAALSETALAWEERAILYGRPVPRSLKRGDIVFWRDFAPQRPEPASGEMAVQIAIRNTPMVPSMIFAGDELGFLIALAPQDETGTTGRSEREGAVGDGTVPEPRPERLDYLGPFRVLAVGADMGQTVDASQKRSGVSQILTIAMPGKAGAEGPDAQSTRLVLAAEGRGPERIAAIVFHQGDDEKRLESSADCRHENLVQPFPGQPAVCR